MTRSKEVARICTLSSKRYVNLPNLADIWLERFANFDTETTPTVHPRGQRYCPCDHSRSQGSSDRVEANCHNHRWQADQPGQGRTHPTWQRGAFPTPRHAHLEARGTARRFCHPNQGQLPIKSNGSPKAEASRDSIIGSCVETAKERHTSHTN